MPLLFHVVASLFPPHPSLSKGHQNSLGFLNGKFCRIKEIQFCYLMLVFIAFELLQNPVSGNHH